MPEQTEENFSYFINSKKHILVVTFKGKAKRADASIFTDCLKEVASSTAEKIIFNLAGVQDISNDAFPYFSNMQLSLRDKNKSILVCGIATSLKSALIERGVIRTNEIVPSLVEALQKIVTPEVK